MFPWWFYKDKDNWCHHLSGQTYRFQPVFTPVNYPVLGYANFTVNLLFSFRLYSSVESDKTSMIKRGDAGKWYIFPVPHITNDRGIGHDDIIIVFTPLVLNTVTKYTAQAVFDLVSYFYDKIMDDHWMFKIGFAYILYG